MSKHSEELAGLRTKAQGHIASAEAIKAKYPDGDVSEADQEAMIGHLGKVDEITANIELLSRMNEQKDFYDEPLPTKASSVQYREAPENEGMHDVDPKSWEEFEINSAYVDPLYGVMPEKKTIRFHVPEVTRKKDYPHAFDSYLRKGLDNMGPTDKKTLTEAVDSAGGFLAPADFQARLIKKIATIATVRPNAMVISTSSGLVQWPRVNYTTDDKYTSPVRQTWTGESPSASTVHRVTDPTFGLIQIPVNTAMASFPISNDLIEDSAFDVENIASELLGEAMALGENDKFWNGDGAGQPAGILRNPDGTDEIASVVSGSASDVTADGLLDFVYALPAQYERNAKIFMSKATEKAIRKLKDANSNYIWPAWMTQGGFAPAPRELLAFPVLRDEFMPAINANTFPIVIGDLSVGYMVVDRVGISIQVLRERYAESNLSVMLARKRVGGGVIAPWAMKAHKMSA